MADEYVYTGEEGKDESRVLDSLVDDENTTPEQAVQQIVDLTLAPKTYSRQLGDHCYFTACGLLAAAARSVPSQQSKLVAFVHKLRSKTIVDPSTGKAFEHEGSVIWTGLPTFGYTFADELHSIPAPKRTPENIGKWENTIAFFAQFDASTQDPKLDFTHNWALKYISCALDDTITTEKSDLVMHLACIWFVYDAEKLWRKVPEDKNFSLTQWQRWKRALEEAESKTSDQATKSTIEKALSEIGRVEKT